MNNLTDREKFELRNMLEESHLWFTKYFFKTRTNGKFLVNWHHEYLCDLIDAVLNGKIQNLIINIAPGSSKTEIVVINLIARGLAKNPFARFLHLSYSDDLASLNSQTARDIIKSDEYQDLWPLAISEDTKAKKRWNVMVKGKKAGGCYATSVAGQVTGFRAGHMTDGFTGAIIIDDPMKPEDAFSKTKVEAANRKLLTTIKSRKANPKVPIVLIMQRISESDPTGFIKSGGMPGNWTIVKIPALLDSRTVNLIPSRYREMMRKSVTDDNGRFSYWEYKEPLKELAEMESGGGIDSEGKPISRYVFNAQYQQEPVAMGGNLIHGKDFVRYTFLPPIKYRAIYADTAQKTKEANDFSVFQCWGYGYDGRIYLIDLIRGKWEAPELQRRARSFWIKHASMETDKARIGILREMKVEDKSSGTGLIQSLRIEKPIIPIKGIERNTDKYTRVLDALPYIEQQAVCIPDDAAFVSDFITECEGFKSDMTHKHDDQIDPMCDAIEDMLSSQNKVKQMENLNDRKQN